MTDTKTPAKPAAENAAATSTPTLDRTWWLILGAILLVATLQQVLILTDAWQNDPLARSPIQDAETYWQWAADISHGQLLGSTPFMSAPLYPYVLGLVRAVGGGLIMVYILQLLVHLATVVLLAMAVGKRFAPTAGLLAAGLFILLMEPAYFVGRPLVSTWQLFFVAALWLRLVTLPKDPTFKGAIGAGVLTGLNCLVNPPMLLAVPLLMVWFWWRHGFAVAAIKQPILVMLGAILLIAPATVHNFMVSHEIIPVSAQAGVTFAQGNIAGANGAYTVIPGVSGSRHTQNLDALRYYTEQTGNPPSWNGCNRYFFKMGLDSWKNNPSYATSLFQRKAYLFVSGHVFGDIYVPPVEIAEGYAKMLRLAPIPLPWLMGGGIIVLVMLLRESPRKYGPELILFLVPFIVVVCFWYSPRYRFPVTPIMVGLAAWGLYHLLRWGKDNQFAILSLAACAVTGWLCYSNGKSNFDGVATYRAFFYNSLAAAEAKEGDYGSAIEHYQKVLKLKPDDSSAKANLGRLLAARGEQGQSIALLQQAIEENPTSAVAHQQLGDALLQAGRTDEAIASYEKALAITPDNAELRTDLAVALQRKGDLTRAAEQFGEALRIDPTSAPAHFALARLLAAQQKNAEALQHATEAIRFAPKTVDARLLAAQLHAAKGENEQAIKLINEAIELAGGPSPQTLDLLAAAQTSAGDYDAAIATLQRLLLLPEVQANAAAKGACEQRIKELQAHQKPATP